MLIWGSKRWTGSAAGLRKFSFDLVIARLLVIAKQKTRQGSHWQIKPAADVLWFLQRPKENSTRPVNCVHTGIKQKTYWWCLHHPKMSFNVSSWGGILFIWLGRAAGSFKIKAQFPFVFLSLTALYCFIRLLLSLTRNRLKIPKVHKFLDLFIEY